MKKVFIICSKAFYYKIPEIKSDLEMKGYQVFLPNCYDNPTLEFEFKSQGEEKHQQFKAKMFKQSEELTKEMDLVLVLNFDKEKNGEIFKNYIGGATFLEMYDAFRFNKKIYLYNDIPEGMLYDEIIGFNTTVINGNLDLINTEKEASFI